MNPKVIITCAVTGAGDTVGKHPAIPVTPEQIANSALEAASAGAAIVHCHVREPETGKGVRNVDYYREVMERIRAKNTDVIINLTAGMGGDLMIGEGETPRRFDEGNTDLVGPVERLLHVAELRPEICTLDCGSLNFGDTNSIVVQTPVQLREQARLIQSYGVKPEMEIFDSGNLWFAKQGYRRADFRHSDVPVVSGHPVGRTGKHTDDDLHGFAIAGPVRMGRIWHRPLANANGGPGHDSRRPRQGRTGG